MLLPLLSLLVLVRCLGTGERQAICQFSKACSGFPSCGSNDTLICSNNFLTCTIGTISEIDYDGECTHIPTQIGLLTNMVSLRLTSTASSRYTIPTQIGALLKLEKIRFTGPNFIGKIPAQLTNSPVLRYFNLDIGKIDDTDLQLSRRSNTLVRLGLSFNGSGRNLTTEILSLKNLEYLGLSMGKSVAGISRSLYQLNKLDALTYIYEEPLATEIGLLTVNELHLTSDTIDSVPKEISTLTSLRSFYFDGPLAKRNFIPDLCSVPVRTLYVSAALSGSFPDCIFQHPTLRSVTITGTLLRGTFPPQITMPAVTHFEISGNLMAGKVPNFSASTRLVYLSLAQNLLTGTIPTLFVPPGISSLDLASNTLTGTLPTSLSSLSYLTFFSIRYNNIIGKIPCIGRMEAGDVIDLSFNLFQSSRSYDFRCYGLNDGYPCIRGSPVVDVSGNRFPVSRIDGVFSCAKNVVWSPQDVDDCAENRFICPNNSVCSNGWFPKLSFTCSCNTGFKKAGDAGECEDINECESGGWVGTCTSKESCINTIGSFQCCPVGFTSNGKSCEDINECLSTNLNKCGFNDRCVNTIGSHRCCTEGTFNPTPDHTDSPCVDCFNNSLVGLDDSKQGLFGLQQRTDQPFNFSRCFGSCDGGLEITSSVSRSPSCGPSKITQSPCSFACANFTQITSSEGMAETLRRELFKGGFIQDVMEKLFSVRIALKDNKRNTQSLMFDLTPCQNVTEIGSIISSISWQILPSAKEITLTTGCPMTISTTDAQSTSTLNLATILVPLICIGLLLLLLVILLWMYSQRRTKAYLLPQEVAATYVEFEVKGLFQKWEYRGDSKSGFFYKECSPGLSQFNRLSNLFGVQDLDLESILIVYNRTLLNNFIGAFTIQSLRLQKGAELFGKTTWKGQEHEWVHHQFNETVSRYPWNDASIPTILPVFHGTDLSVAEKICETGFAALSSLDAGWYGKGIYFSTKYLYCTSYIQSKKNPAVIVSWLLPGNAYPVIQSPNGPKPLIGAALKPGYQSHFVVTDSEGLPVISDSKDRLYDELVVDQESQIVPVCILKVSSQGLNTMISNWTSFDRTQLNSS